MRNTLFVFGLIAGSVFLAAARADTFITVTNGGGSYSGSTLAFYDANGTYLVLDGTHGLAQVSYPGQPAITFPYVQTIAGLSVTGTWSGIDAWGYAYTASVQESLVQTKHSGSGRGGGYKTTITTSLGSGKIIYDYAGAYAPPLVAPVVTGNSTSTTISLSWTAASGGVPSYTYSVVDQDGVDLVDTSGLSATFSGLTPASAYSYTVIVTDSAGRQVASATTTIYTAAPTLDTVFTYDPNTNSVRATWQPDPTAVSYSVFYYDWALGAWIDGADTTGTSATVSGWSPDVYISFYIAAYDVNGVETDYDQQLVSVQAPPPPGGGGDDGGGD